MGIGACIKKIDKHLANDNVQPLIVDVQNRKDLSDLITHYSVGGNVFVAASDYCNTDEYPHIDTLWDALSRNKERFFVTGLSAFLKLQGEQVLRDTLKDILNMTTVGHVIAITYQCRQYLSFADPRLKQRICIVEGTADDVQSLIFSSLSLPLPYNAVRILGIHSLGDAVESKSAAKLYVETKKQKDTYPNSIYSIINLSNAYDVLAQRDSLTLELQEACGTYGQWSYALDKFSNKKGWADLIDSEFGNRMTLDIAFPSYSTFEADRQWLYYVGLKLYGAKNNWCLNEAAKKASFIKELAKQAYRSILDIPRDNPNFEKYYQSRKILIAQLGNPMDEVIDFCSIVQEKGKDAIYYLTDNTQKEKELIFQLLDRYAGDYSKENMLSALKLVYPALYQYLSPYRFKNDLLDSYFQSYKYQKVINRILPEFEEIVTEQATKREYNLVLEPRSSKIESIDRTGAQLYFVDAMGVEYLSYIMSVCGEMGLMANVSVCSCELPSITSKNKEFLELFENGTMPVVSIKDIDDIKHHGKDDYDYQQTKLPIHLIKELEVLKELLEKIKERLAAGTVDKAILIADHGASRLAVIHETESIWEMSSKGEHSGRCCLKIDVDAQPEYATDAGEFWALANYDRFKGGRKANVEVHGGATLEEITVPIIELTYLSGAVEVHLLPVNATTSPLDAIPEIEVSYRKKATIKIFATAKLHNVSISIEGKHYDAAADGSGFYTVEMPDIKRAKTYSVDVYACGNRIAKGLKLKVKKEGSSERDLL